MAEVNNNYTDMKNLTPFKLCVLQNFPFIEADFDSVTNYQLLCKVVEYLNKVVDNNNKQNDNIRQLEQNFITLYNYVKDYFDNLDVQDEINKKLDEMAKSGKLAEIVYGYVTPEMFGAVGDGVTDDTTSLTSCFWYSYTNKIPCFLNKKYGVKKQVQISFDCFMSKDSEIIALEQVKTNAGEERSLVYVGAYHTENALINVHANGNSKQKITIEIGLCRRCIINAYTKDFTDKGFYNHIDNGNHENVFNVWAYGLSNGSNYGVYNTSGDNVYDNIITVDCKTGVYTNVILKANQIHTWLTNAATFIGSKTLEVVNGWTNNIIDIGWLYQDGVETGIITDSDCGININTFTFVESLKNVDYSNALNINMGLNAVGYININQYRCNDATSSLYTLKVQKSNKYAIISVNNITSKKNAIGFYPDLDSVPDKGTFTVHTVTTPVTATDATVICNASKSDKSQTLFYGGEIFIRFWKFTSQDTWGIWRKVSTTNV